MAFPETIEASKLTGINGTLINGDNRDDDVGTAFSKAGDFNGDGFDDIIVGARGFDSSDMAGGEFTSGGRAYILYGDAIGFNTPAFTLDNADAFNSFRLDGDNTGANLGLTVSEAGDVNKDGFDDVLVGLVSFGDERPMGANPPPIFKAAATLIYGRDTETGPSIIQASDVDGGEGVRIYGYLDTNEAPSFFVGSELAGGGDVNGDGYDDFLVGSESRLPPFRQKGEPGEAYVFFGAAELGKDLYVEDLNGVNGFKIVGRSTDVGFGSEVAMIGDINGDGRGDVIVGADLSSDAAEKAGEAFVILGSGSGFGTEEDVNDLNGVNGFRIIDPTPGLGVGGDVSAAGDFNGDGLADFIVGTQVTAQIEGGEAPRSAAYVVFGSRETFDGTLNLRTLDGTNGFKISDQLTSLGGNELSDFTGHSVAAAGDVNNDGFDDIIVSAEGAGDGNVVRRGDAYVVFGSDKSFGSVLDLTTLDGTNGFKVEGLGNSQTYFGATLASAGDFRGDGADDILIGVNGVGGTTNFGVLIYGDPGTANTAPFAGNDGIDIDVGDDITVSRPGLLQNDGDADSDPVSVVLVNEVEGSVGTPVQGTYGTLTVNADGSLSYASDDTAQATNIAAGETVDDTFTYTISDGRGGAAQATLTVSITAPDDEGDTGGGTPPPTGGGGGGTSGGGSGGGSTPTPPPNTTGGDGADTLTGGATADTLSGGGGNDTLFSGEGDDVAFGGEGDDVIFGGGGNDTTAGGPGNDQLFGGEGDDEQAGGEGNDVIGGGTGNDQGFGGEGEDTLFGGEGADTTYGGDDNDRLYGGTGDDINAGGNGDDEIGAGTGNDQVAAGEGADTVYGADGDDTIFASSGADSVFGGSGDDVVYLGANDGETDVYNAAANNGTDVVFGFEDGTDLLNLTASGFTSFTDVQSRIGEDADGNATIDLGNGDILTLNGIAQTDLDETDFQF